MTTRRRRLQGFFRGTLVTGIASVLVLTVWTLWPIWEQYQAVRLLVRAVNDARLLAPGPTIARLVKDVKRLHASHAAVIALMDALVDDDLFVREHAEYALGEIGPDAEAALPALVERLGDPDTDISGRASNAISKIGLRASNWNEYRLVSALVKAFKYNGYDLIERAVEEIKTIQMSDRAISELVEELQSHDPVTIQGAIYVLGRFGPDAKEAVPALTSVGLNAEDSLTRELAINSLAYVGSEAQGAVPALINALTDRNETVRRASAAALGRIGPNAQESVPAMIRALHDQDAEVCINAARSLWQVTHDAGVALPTIVRFLEEDDTRIRWLALGALQGIGPDAQLAVPALIEILKLDDESTIVRQDAAAALNEIDPEAAAAAGVSGAKWYEGF